MSASVDYNPLSKSYGVFTIGAVPADGVTAEELEASLEKAWKEALDELSLDEVQKTKQKMLAGLVYLRDNPEDAAYIVGSMRSVGVALSEIENQADKIKAVDYRDVKNAAAEMTAMAPQVTGILYPGGGSDAQ